MRLPNSYPHQELSTAEPIAGRKRSTICCAYIATDCSGRPAISLRYFFKDEHESCESIPLQNGDRAPTRADASAPATMPTRPLPSSITTKRPRNPVDQVAALVTISRRLPVLRSASSRTVECRKTPSPIDTLPYACRVPAPVTEDGVRLAAHPVDPRVVEDAMLVRIRLAYSSAVRDYF
jgi:hypothetical protein